MKILLVHNFYQQRAGEYTALQAQMALLRAHEVPFALHTRDNREIEHFGLAQKVAALPNTVFSRQSYAAMRETIRREQPDIAHVHNVFPLLSPAVYVALRDAGVPVVQTLHNFRLLCANSLFYTNGQICERCKHGATFHALRFRCHRDSLLSSASYAASIAVNRWTRTFQHIDRFIALTEFSAQKMVESGLLRREQISVLGNFMPEPLPAPGPAEGRAPFLLFLGRLSEEKGVATLLDAMPHLPGVTLKVLGDGPERAALEAQARAVAPGRVEFLGFVEGEAKWALLRRASATVVPSVWYENFPFTVLESLAVGTPVIASNLGSFPYIVGHGESGLLFAPRDPLDLAAQARTLLDDPTLAQQMGARARALVEERYTARVHFRSLMAHLPEVAGRRVGRGPARPPRGIPAGDPSRP